MARAFDLALKMRNATLYTALGRVEQMKTSEEWKKACALTISQDRNLRFAVLRQQYGIRKYDLHAVAGDCSPPWRARLPASSTTAPVSRGLTRSPQAGRRMVK